MRKTCTVLCLNCKLLFLLSCSCVVLTRVLQGSSCRSAEGLFNMFCSHYQTYFDPLQTSQA